MVILSILTGDKLTILLQVWRIPCNSLKQYGFKCFNAVLSV